MDIHELRKFESVYKPSKEVAFCWLRKQYVQLSTEENHTEIVDHANDSLRIWQATKAQAVPEGFVLVKTSDIVKLAIAVSRVDLMTYSEARPDSEKLAWQNVANKLEAMITAPQEPAND